MGESAADESERVAQLEKQYDIMFAYRYTDDDADYVATVAKPIAPCPCVEGYFSKAARNFDRNRGGRGGGYNRGGRGQWNRDHGQGRQYEGQRHGYHDHGQRSRDGYERSSGGYEGQNYNRYQQQDYKRPKYNDR